jgi:hypothetical protein
MYIVKRSTRSGSFEPVSLYDENNNYRGIAVFDSRKKALAYMKRYKDKLIKHFLGNNRNRADLKTEFKV